MLTDRGVVGSQSSKKCEHLEKLYDYYAQLSARFRKSPIFLPRNLSYRRRFRDRSNAKRNVLSLKQKLKEERDSVRRCVSFHFVQFLMNIGSRERGIQVLDTFKDKSQNNRGSFIKLHFAIVREYVGQENGDEEEKRYKILCSDVARVPLAARKHKYAHRRRIMHRKPTKKNSRSLISTGIDLSRYCEDIEEQEQQQQQQKDLKASDEENDIRKRHNHFVLLKVLGHDKTTETSGMRELDEMSTTTTPLTNNNNVRMTYSEIIEFASTSTFRQNQKEKSMFVASIPLKPPCKTKSNDKDLNNEWDVGFSYYDKSKRVTLNMASWGLSLNLNFYVYWETGSSPSSSLLSSTSPQRNKVADLEQALEFSKRMLEIDGMQCKASEVGYRFLVGDEKNEDGVMPPPVLAILCEEAKNGVSHPNIISFDTFRCPICTLMCATLEGVLCHLVSSHEYFHVSIDIPKPRHPHKFLVTLKPLPFPTIITTPSSTTTRTKKKTSKKRKKGELFQFVKRLSCLKRHILSSDLEEPTKRRKYFHSRRHVPRIVKDSCDYDSDEEADERWKIRVSDQLLDEFSDIARPEKLVMMLWNHFVAKQPIYSESAVEYWVVHFCRTRLNVIQEHKLQIPVMLHLFNLYDNSLLSSKVMDHCVKILDDNMRNVASFSSSGMNSSGSSVESE